MIKPVISNSAAGLPHPGDPNLLIQQVSVASATGMPTSGGSKVYGYDASDRLVTVTWTINSDIYVKTWTRDVSGKIISRSDWVKQ